MPTTAVLGTMLGIVCSAKGPMLDCVCAPANLCQTRLTPVCRHVQAAGCAVGTASANDNVEKLTSVLGRRIDPETFTPAFFNSPAFQVWWCRYCCGCCLYCCAAGAARLAQACIQCAHGLACWRSDSTKPGSVLHVLAYHSCLQAVSVCGEFLCFLLPYDL